MERVCGRGHKSFGIGGAVMEEYVKVLLEQIRCKKAHPMIEQEIRDHIEEQARANMEEGMEKEEAVKSAVLEMGDPVEAGVALDGIHRPQAAWGMILFVAALSLISVVIHALIGMGAEEIGSQSGGAYVIRSVEYAGIGFLLMILIYRLDYSMLGKYGKLCAFGFLACVLFFTWSMVASARLYVGTSAVNGQLYLNVGTLLFSPKYLSFLYVPVYGAVLYQYRKTGFGGIFAALLFMAVPVWFVRHIPGVGAALQLFLILSVMLSAAVWNGWFLVPKKIFLSVYWGLTLVLPAAASLLAMSGRFLAPYQRQRLLLFFKGGFAETDYVSRTLSDCLAGSRIFGAGDLDVAGNLPDYNSDYILTFLSGCYGIAAACLICVLVCALAGRALRISLLQRNQLGMMIGTGCSLTLFLNTAVNVAENIGLLPGMGSFLPFFSHNGSGIIVSYSLIGFVLSVYRYKNIPMASNARPRSLLRGWRKENC